MLQLLYDRLWLVKKKLYTLTLKPSIFIIWIFLSIIYIYILIGYWICAVSSSSIRVVHDQKWIVTGIIDKRLSFLRLRIKYTVDEVLLGRWWGRPWNLSIDHIEAIYGRRPWTITRSGRFNRPYNGRTDRQHLAKSDMTERLINPWLSPKVLGAVDLHQQFPAVEEVISELIGFREPWGSY